MLYSFAVLLKLKRNCSDLQNTLLFIFGKTKNYYTYILWPNILQIWFSCHWCFKEGYKLPSGRKHHSIFFIHVLLILSGSISAQSLFMDSWTYKLCDPPHVSANLKKLAYFIYILKALKLLAKFFLRAYLLSIINACLYN